jgi:hypothetical protein
VARAILGGDPVDAQELEDARCAAIDVLKVFAEIDRAGGRPLVDLDWHRRRCCLEAYASAAFYAPDGKELLSFHCDAHGEVVTTVRDAARRAAEPKQPYEAPTLTPCGRVPSITLHVVPSIMRPGEVSLRCKPTDTSWSPIVKAINDAGFQAGDVVRLTKVPT